MTKRDGSELSETLVRARLETLRELYRLCTLLREAGKPLRASGQR